MNWFGIMLMILGVVMLINIVGIIIWAIVELIKPPEKESNGTRIRNYDDEDLAEFLAKVAVYQRDKRVRRLEYKKMFLNWLKQGADS